MARSARCRSRSGANVALNAPVLSVVDLSKFEVEIKVPESFARDLGIGMPAQLTSGNGEPYPGAVSAVSPEVVNGEVTARLRFTDKQPPGLRQNQRLSARIVLDTRRNVLQVERGPFVEQDGGRFAYVMDGSTAVRRPIRTGVSSLNAVETARRRATRRPHRGLRQRPVRRRRAGPYFR